MIVQLICCYYIYILISLQPPSEMTTKPELVELPLRNDSFHLSMNIDILLSPNSQTQLQDLKSPQDVSNGESYHCVYIF